jgi:hypothetical protein
MNTRQFNTHDDKYFITEYGNGWAYEVECAETGYSFWVQDQDADDLRTSTNDFEDTYVLSEMMSVLGEPTDQAFAQEPETYDQVTEEEKWKRAFDIVKNHWYNNDVL